jgi:phosphoribosylformylglycinamidine synthase
MDYAVRIAVTLKHEVLDPAGQATEAVVQERGFPEVHSVRIGKMVDLVITAGSQDDALERARRLAKEFLANPVLERYDVWLVPDAS